MAWKPKTPGTAKISVEVRWILVDKVDSILFELKLLRQRAVAYASPEAAFLLATEIPLPHQSKSEIEELQCSSQQSGFCVLPEVVQTDEPSLLELVLGSAGSANIVEADSDTHDLDETWFQIISDASGTPDPFGLLDFLFPEETTSGSLASEPEPQAPDCCGDGPCDDCMQLDDDTPTEGESDSSVNEHDRWDEYREDLSDETHDIDARDSLHPLLTPWCESFPNRLEEYLDRLDTVNVNDATVESSAGQIDHAYAAKELMRFLRRSPTPIYPVGPEQLLELQIYIQQVTHFRSYLTRSLIAVSNALNRREDRYKMMTGSGDITVLMRSHGEGSPLVEGISADEEWPDEDNWGMPVMKTPRKKIFDGSTPTWLRSPRASPGTDKQRFDPFKKNSVKKIKW